MSELARLLQGVGETDGLDEGVLGVLNIGRLNVGTNG